MADAEDVISELCSMAGMAVPETTRADSRRYEALLDATLAGPTPTPADCLRDAEAAQREEAAAGGASPRAGTDSTLSAPSLALTAPVRSAPQWQPQTPAPTLAQFCAPRPGRRTVPTTAASDAERRPVRPAAAVRAARPARPARPEEDAATRSAREMGVPVAVLRAQDARFAAVMQRADAEEARRRGEAMDAPVFRAPAPAARVPPVLDDPQALSVKLRQQRSRRQPGIALAGRIRRKGSGRSEREQRKQRFFKRYVQMFAQELSGGGR